MNRLTAILVGTLAAVALLVGVPASCTYVNPGNVGVVIHRGGGGVDSVPVGPGIHFTNPIFTGIEEYPTFMQTLVLTKSEHESGPADDEINVNSVEGQPLALDVSLAFDIDGTKAPKLYSTFRTDLSTISHNYVKQTVRQALQEVIGQEEIAGIIGPKKAEATNRVQALVTTRLAQYGIVVKQFTINELRAPKTVIDAINDKNVMQQQALTAQNKLEKARFEATQDSIVAAGQAKAEIAAAEGKARSNELLQRSITTQVLELKRLEIQAALAEKWNGALPATVLGNSGSNLFQLPLGGAKQ